MNRTLASVVILAAAVALPVTIHFERQAQARVDGLKLAVDQLERQKSGLARLEAQAKRYREYVAEVTGFVETADRHGINAEGWDRHEVSIEDMFLAYPEFQGFLADMKHTEQAYFVPKHAEVVANPTRLGDAPGEARAAKREPFAGGVTLSLEGEFLVRRP